MNNHSLTFENLFYIMALIVFEQVFEYLGGWNHGVQKTDPRHAAKGNIATAKNHIPLYHGFSDIGGLI